MIKWSLWVKSDDQNDTTTERTDGQTDPWSLKIILLNSSDIKSAYFLTFKYIQQFCQNLDAKQIQIYEVVYNPKPNKVQP